MKIPEEWAPLEALAYEDGYIKGVKACIETIRWLRSYAPNVTGSTVISREEAMAACQRLLEDKDETD